MRFTRAIAIAIAILSAPATALAQGKPASGGETAVDHSANARAAYERGAFREAIELYEKAYALDANPTLLFNLGRCYEALATALDLRVAVEKYEAYLAKSKAPSDRAAVERRIEALREQIRVLEKERERALAKPTIEPEPKRPPPPPPEAPSPWPWVLAGVGGAAVTAGIILSVVAVDIHADAEASASGEEALDLEGVSRPFATAANVNFAVGGAMLIAGGIWGIVDLVEVSLTNRGREGAVRLYVGFGTLGLSGEL